MTDLGIAGLSDVELIASGGSALVYRARTEAGMAVAVKVLRGMRGAEIARRFDREQSATERLREHPNIIDVYSSGMSSGGEPYLIMPLMARGSLADELEAGPLSLDRAIDDMLAATEAIDFAHRRGVLHRDLKPGNLLRTDDDSVVVADFGIARVIDAGITSATVGATTPLFAAPELLADNEASVQSDVYSLGAVLYALLAGAPAFSGGKNLWATIARVRTDAPPAIAGVPSPVMRVIDQAMAKQPWDRPATAHQLHLNLLAARDAPADWTPPSPAQATLPIPLPGPASVPVVRLDRPGTPPHASGPSEPEVPAATGFDAPAAARSAGSAGIDTPAPPPVGIGGEWLRFGAGVAAVVALAVLIWFGFTRIGGGDESADSIPERPPDTSLPPLTSVPGSAGSGDDDPGPGDDPGAAPEPSGSDSPDDEPGADSSDPEPGPEPTAVDRLVSFTGDYFSAYFPEGWSVTRGDVDVGYGYRSEFVNGDMYLNIDTTPAERRDGRAVVDSAHEIAATLASASAVRTELIDDLEIHWFTFRNNRGVPSIDVFFEVDGDGYAIVAGSRSEPEAAFAIARQVAATVRSDG